MVEVEETLLIVMKYRQEHHVVVMVFVEQDMRIQIIAQKIARRGN